MKVLNEVQTDSVGGGLQFVAYADQYEAAPDWLPSAGGGWITSGSYFSSGSGSSGSSSSSGGYGAHMVNPAACKIDVENAAGIGAILGAILGGVIGARGGATTAAGGALVGGFAGAGLGQLYGLQSSPNCQPKK